MKDKVMKTKGKAMWSRLIKPDTKWEPQWSITLELDKEEAAKLKKVGLKVVEKVQDDESIIRSYKFSRRVKRRGKGTGVNRRPIVVDPALNPFPRIVGNGSDVFVIHEPYDWNWGGKKGTSTDLQGVQVINFIPYENETENASVEQNPGFEVVGEAYDAVEGEDEVLYGDNDKEEVGDDDPF